MGNAQAGSWSFDRLSAGANGVSPRSSVFYWLHPLFAPSRVAPVENDIYPILRDWPYVPDQISVRLIEGEEGAQFIQLRLDLGLLQMALDDRPDGQMIEDFPSLLDLHEHRKRVHEEENPDAAGYTLQGEDCAELLREGLQYYQRYLSFWHLGMYELCARDTARNLRLLRFIREHALSDRDKMQFDQWRPYVTMMHSRAVATPLVELRQWEAALGAIDAGIKALHDFLEEYAQQQHADRLGELAFLERWRKEVASLAGIEDASTSQDHKDPLTRLRDDLQSAIDDERYEEAARIRDELRRLEEPPPPLMT